MASPPVAEVARELGIELDQPESVNDETARARIVEARPAALCVCGFGALIKEPLLSTHRMLNVHPSLLPRWRGAAPIERAIMAGDDRTGVSIMQVTAGLDSGPVCAVEVEPIASWDTYGKLAERLARLGGELLVRVLDDDPPCVPQDEAAVIYADKIGPEDRRLHPERPAAELARVVRALTPHIGAFLEVGEVRLGVLEARALSAGDGPREGELSVESGRPLLGCRSGALELLVVQPPGRRAVSGGDYVRGLHGGGH
jgi:methionyl-tRNA formyltransferase